MKVKKRDLRKRLPQIPINYPGPDVIPFDYDAEKGKVENLCKRLADSEVAVRDAVLAELPRFIKDVCAPFVKDGALDEAERTAVAEVDLTAHDAGRLLWDALDAASESARNLGLLFEKLALGLFYCMWHSDKPLVQHECALKIVQLLEIPPTPLLRELWLRSMLRMLVRHWGKVDQYRMDKYMALVRKLCFHVMNHLVAAVQASIDAAADAAPVATAVADASASPSKKKSSGKKAAAASASSTSSTNKADNKASAAVDKDDPTSCARHPSMLRVAASFQHDVIRSESVGLTMHVCDLMLTEMIRCEKMRTPLFVAVAVAIPLYAMQRGDYIEKRVMDNFVVPVAAGQLERRSDEFSIETATILSAQLDALSVARGTHFKVRPLMVEAHRLVENYVGVKTQPDEYEAVSHRDERLRIASEVRAAEDIKMKMSRIAMKHAAAAGAVRAVRRSTTKAQPTSKRNARWKKR